MEEGCLALRQGPVSHVQDQRRILGGLSSPHRVQLGCPVL